MINDSSIPVTGKFSVPGFYIIPFSAPPEAQPKNLIRLLKSQKVTVGTLRKAEKPHELTSSVHHSGTDRPLSSQVFIFKTNDYHFVKCLYLWVGSPPFQGSP